MQIFSPDGTDLLQRWLRERTALRVEAIGANIALSFTGVLARYESTEVVVARGSDEISISTFCGTCSVSEGPSDPEPHGFWQHYRRVVQITTDAGAQCSIYELRISLR